MLKTISTIIKVIKLINVCVKTLFFSLQKYENFIGKNTIFAQKIL